MSLQIVLKLVVTNGSPRRMTEGQSLLNRDEGDLPVKIVKATAPGVDVS